MSAWYWESGPTPTLEERDAKFIKVEIVEQSLATWDEVLGSASKLPNLDWTTDAILGDGFPWNVPDLDRISNIEPNAVGNSSITIEAMNEFANVDGNDVASGALAVGMHYKVVGYTTVTYNSIIYTAGQTFLCVTGVLTYATTGAGTVEKNFTPLKDRKSVV